MAFPAYGTAGTEQEVNSTSNPQTLNVPFPSGLSANDILVVAATNRTSGSAISTPTDFTQGDSRQQGNVLGKMFWKRATGSESGTLAVERTAGTNLFYAVMFRLTGCVTSGTPFDVNAQDGAGAATSFVPPDLDPADAKDRLMVSMMFVAGDAIALGNFTGGTATITERLHVDTPTGSDATIHVADAQHGADTLFDFGSQDPDASSYQVVYFTFAFLPATGGTVTFDAAIAGTGALTADVALTRALAAAIAGSGAVVPDFVRQLALDAVVNGTATVLGDVTVSSEVAFEAALAGVSVVTADVALNRVLAAVVAGQAVVVATLDLPSGQAAVIVDTRDHQVYIAAIF